MTKKSHKTGHCSITNKEYPLRELFPIELLRNSVLETAKKLYPDFPASGYICNAELRRLRDHHIEQMLLEEKGELSELDKEVLESLRDHETVAENINTMFDRSLSFGEKLSDRIAQFGGSWFFICSFLAVIIIWMVINAVALKKPFDPYPFILLNLFLSCLAAFQAPVIMMSQNRQAEKDRLQADDSYCTSLKAELEIRQIHTKIDQLMKNQWDRLMEIQKIQIDLVEDLLEEKRRGKK